MASSRGRTHPELRDARSREVLPCSPRRPAFGSETNSLWCALASFTTTLWLACSGRASGCGAHLDQRVRTREVRERCYDPMLAIHPTLSVLHPGHAVTDG